ncbi:MAG TPA: aspartate/glutamate racemase family protein [Spirochaetia bacterium]|nr:aspartate/glutamate racemase family protein [Spirochaetia bacterium]
MAKILYLVPGVGLSDEEKKRRENLANSFLTQKENRVFVDDVDEGPSSIESSVEEFMSVPGTLKKLVEVQEDYDAMIIGCAGDPGLVPARELARIPVIGPIESSLAVASMLGENFSIITVLDSIVPAIWHILRAYGLEHKCASVRVVNCPVLDLAGKLDQVVDAFLQESQKAVKEDRAASLVLGCMSMAFLLVDELARGKVDVPIINPAKVSVKAAEMLVSLGLSQSRATYPKPNYEKLKKSVFPKLRTGGKE